MRAELESMRSTLNRELANFRQGKFDPVKYIEETANLSKQLQTEIGKRKELEQEIEHIKKGSIAVIKYVKTQQLKAGVPLDAKKRLEQEQKLREEIETEAAKLRSVNETLKKQIESGFAKLKPDQREMKKQEADLVEREASLRAKEERSAAIHPDEVTAPTEELKRRLEEELREMEQDYLAKEEQFKRRIIVLEGEVGKYKIEDRVREQAQVFEGKSKSEIGGAISKKEHDVLQRERTILLREQDLQRLQEELQVKEDEIRKVKEPLAYKEEELLRREEDLEAREQDLQIEVKQQKVKTGIPRLDDLMFGGIPFGTNASVYGPAYVGKEVLVNLFMAEGLKKGSPILWVLTDKGPADVRDEMAFVLPGYEEYEKLGLVRYIDAYSKSMGAEATDSNTTYIDEATDHQSILKAVETIAAEWKKKYPTYRLGFRSVSTLIAYLDPTTTFKFLQPFVGRRKRDKAVAFYVIEKGMHEEQEIQMLGSLMDGSIEFKVEQLKSFLSIKGICDVQSRGWIRYTYTKSSVSVGSFSLDHIK